MLLRYKAQWEDVRQTACPEDPGCWVVTGRPATLWSGEGSHRSALDALSPRLLDASDRGRGVLGKKRDWRQEQQFHGKQWSLQQDVGAPLSFTRPRCLYALGQ